MIFSAQKVSIDNELQTLIATGNVKLELDNIKLSSKEIIYYKNKDEIHAKGNVFLKMKMVIFIMERFNFKKSNLKLLSFKYLRTIS